MVNAMYVKHPKTIKDAVAEFAKYYTSHRRKEVVFYYDHTAIARNASNDLSYADELIAALKQHSWAVRGEYIGRTPGYETRYRLMEMLFSRDKRLSRFGYNRNNCADWEIAMQAAGTRQTTKGFEKDKTGEKDANVPPEHATHQTDAFDTLVVGTQYRKVAGGF